MGIIWSMDAKASYADDGYDELEEYEVPDPEELRARRTAFFNEVAKRASLPTRIERKPKPPTDVNPRDWAN
jgi:hypothetical protein